MTQFRPCIDLHQGKVKQIVGGSLNASGAQTNYISEYDAAHYAKLYRDHNLTGGHVIALGEGNQAQVELALKTWPQGLQVGGGVNAENAAAYLEAGASHIIVTSYLFENDQFSWERLDRIKSEVGKQHLVLDLSCRKQNDSWFIATNRWQTVTSTEVSEKTLLELATHCDEFLIHAADVEGLQAGIDSDLVSLLGRTVTIPTVYAGGARNIADLEKVNELSKGKVDLTIGSALDIFGGNGITLDECIKWNNRNND
ncbi:phosphoribosylformimino-5-aminoimidazole carboxamide ribotide isomerase [Alkalimarinus sediminis]|uniref:Phosphoribosylformimino-5-aminoimidazole carboxamide ribotide isomerase n=1 Tax=Alkalimarinus sediminis TaxID=1632866 RepID=A0A9E8KME3_9ALTE|nr:phosphoribosylformimino-5-aminoimidazole carboxamide ribotide isomerase [Alkalimarinus sediminis]UZW73343.1 phosphoribosylformimino-5-aminoimidazole carboxamide ribotide isomerase [Alkalimarinus sediminis]